MTDLASFFFVEGMNQSSMMLVYDMYWVVIIGYFIED